MNLNNFITILSLSLSLSLSPPRILALFFEWSICFGFKLVPCYSICCIFSSISYVCFMWKDTISLQMTKIPGNRVPPSTFFSCHAGAKVNIPQTNLHSTMKYANLIANATHPATCIELANNVCTKDEQDMFFQCPDPGPPDQIFVFSPGCKISWWNFPWPWLTWRHPFEAPIYPTLTGLDRGQDRFMFAFVACWFVIRFLLFVGVHLCTVYYFTTNKI